MSGDESPWQGKEATKNQEWEGSLRIERERERERPRVNLSNTNCYETLHPADSQAYSLTTDNSKLGNGPSDL
jgi:hypothetical protein